MRQQAAAEPRLSLADSGHIRYSLKTPWRDGTTHVLFEPLDFIARIEDPDVITRILDHLKSRTQHQTTQQPRAPPIGLFPKSLTTLH